MKRKFQHTSEYNTPSAFNTVKSNAHHQSFVPATSELPYPPGFSKPTSQVHYASKAKSADPDWMLELITPDNTFDIYPKGHDVKEYEPERGFFMMFLINIGNVFMSFLFQIGWK